MNLTLNISTGNTVKLNLPSQQTVLTAVSTVNNLTVSSVGIPGPAGPAGIQDVVSDTTPQLGGNLDVNGKKITSTSNGDIDIEPNGTGDVLLGNFKFDADQSVGSGQDNHVLTYDNSTQKISLEAPTGVGGLANIVEDTTPQLGGDFDVNGHEIISASNGDIELNPHGTGDVKLGNFIFDVDQSVGAGQDNHVLTYDNSTQKISLEASSGGGGGISNLVEDTSPQLGGDLDVQASEISTSISNGNVKLNPNGTGVVEIKGDGTTDGTVGTLQLNCSNNNHGVKIASPPHSAGASYTLTLPVTDGNANQILTTDGSGNLSFKTLPQSMSFTAEARLANNRYYFGSLRYGWNYVVWSGNDNDMTLQRAYVTGAHVAINDYTKVSVKGQAGSMYSGSAGEIEFTVWKGTPQYDTVSNVACTQIATTTIDFDNATQDVFKQLSFGATGLTINEGDYIFLAVRDPDYSAREDIFIGATITLSD